MKTSSYLKLLPFSALGSYAAPLASKNPTAVLFERQIGLPDALTCPASAWPPTTVGFDNTLQDPDGLLTDLLSRISVANIESHIVKLVSFVTRATLSVDISNSTFGIAGARDWLYDEFNSYALANPESGLEVSLNSYIQGPDGSRILFPVNISNVVAFLPGTTYRSAAEPGRVYVISGHYDSRNSDPLNYADPSPGADDDASGVALSLELARIFSSPDVPKLRASLVFVAVAGEEQNLYGSNNLAFTYRNSTQPINVEGMLDNDIIGSPKARNSYDTGNAPSSSDPNTIRLFAQGLPSLTVENATIRARRITVGGEDDSPTRNLARFLKEVSENAATNMSIAIINRQDRYLRGGDHSSFLAAGYSAVRFTEPYEDYRHQHQDVRVAIDPDFPDAGPVQYGDLPEFVDYEYTARVGKVNLAGMYSLAQSPGVPQNVYINTTLSNDSQFFWDPPVDGEERVGGYEIVWRATTAPQWQKVIDVGMGEVVVGGNGRRAATIGLGKDNVVFGVRARSVDGFRGVAVFPFPLPT
ncbi:hypothetical protein LTR64_002440 [Lithohypha guttulata]|uniref:uncharacterized protein n=1 Tax=Lithohypha guttulata TaxID=1690604 RepID=UPI002DE0C001|nr:hypothetical protein LTR51_001334 [Lithohypha guttulata]